MTAPTPYPRIDAATQRRLAQDFGAYCLTDCQYIRQDWPDWYCTRTTPETHLIPGGGKCILAECRRQLAGIELRVNAEFYPPRAVVRLYPKGK